MVQITETDHFRTLAMGELFNNLNEFLEPMVNQWFDYIRIHVSQIGGIIPAMKIAWLGEFFNISMAWQSRKRNG